MNDKEKEMVNKLIIAIEIIDGCDKPDDSDIEFLHKCIKKVRLEIKKWSCPEKKQEVGIVVIDIEKVFWEDIKKASEESEWIPKEYYMNDWVADVCNFLRKDRLSIGNKNGK